VVGSGTKEESGPDRKMGKTGEANKCFEFEKCCKQPLLSKIRKCFSGSTKISLEVLFSMFRK
jgi:hypothetical protein